ncbi:exosortase/archaeosortase family protein [Gloeobacter violaceus]|uniref:Gll1178 protein n=1 Tax=Gloeobacter violaceus (strain ATCC 29082 / PCC 7421) TaxID=251221 RepID=Q7NLE6_GLOVI|nr:exosortase/archaeosortase family protein [Gloeobacter violaceus]BAC89119.1 gll1178 [Gloeobacter violaceus PCC 7421]
MTVKSSRSISLEASLWWLLLAAVGGCFAPVLLACALLWTEGGGLENRAVALVAAGYLFVCGRATLLEASASPFFQGIGLACLMGGLLLVQLPALSVQSLAFCFALAGLALLRWGDAALRRLAKPFVIVTLAMLTSGLADSWLPRYTPVVLWLQQLVAGLAAYALWMAGFAVEWQQTVIRLGDTGGVDVNAACSGVRSLLEIGVLATAAIFTLSRRSRRDNGFYLALCAALVLALNAGRVLLLAVASVYWGRPLFDALHEGWGAQLYSGGISAATVLFTCWYFRWNPFDTPKAGL